MRSPRRWRVLEGLVGAALIAGCGGGERPPDIFPSTGQPAPQPVAGPDSFLLFPNPQITPDGAPPAIDSEAYARAYYKAIDPGDTRTTLADWKRANGFDQPGGVQVSAVFGDFRDLGYGRRMTGRRNADNTIAFVVENYLVSPGGGYGGSINIDAAVVQDRQWIVSINAIEFSIGTGGTVKYAKFYSFDPVTEARRLTQDLDGRGQKALPGACISCHGGRGDPLTADGRFALLQNSEPAQRGDVRGRFHVLEADALTFSGAAGYTRADQEAALKTMNTLVLCTYPYTSAAVATATEDLCRPTDTSGIEWQGAAAAVVKAAYGGDGLPSATYSAPAVPAGWVGQADLYNNVVVPACRSCHIVRGTGQESDIDFTTFAKFDGYASRIKYLVYDRGNMPLAKVVFDRFWSTDMADRLAAYLDAHGGVSPGRDAAGALLRAGHPVADPGPARRVAPGATVLRGGASLFATSYLWSIVSGPVGASLTGADTATPTFTAPAAAAGQTYTLQLVAGNDTATSAPTPLALYVTKPTDPNPDPAAVRYAQIQPLLVDCAGCHALKGSPPQPGLPPLALRPQPTDVELHNVLRGMVNFSDVPGSPVLRRPANHHHSGGGLRFGFDDTKGVGDPARTGLDQMTDWILNGAPGP